jgi:hypothetical protein
MSILLHDFKHDKILITRAEAFIINNKYHITNKMINDQSV